MGAGMSDHSHKGPFAELVATRASPRQKAARRTRPGGARPRSAAPAPAADGRAWLDVLYRRHWTDLCAWLRRRYGAGPPEPEDVAAEAFAKLAARDDIDKVRDVRAYLFTTAARCAIDALRGRARLTRFIDDQLAQYGREVGELTPERVYSAREQLAALAEDLKSMTPRQRETLLRSRILGQTYDQISAATGWSPSAVGRYMQSAMRVLLDNAAARAGDGGHDAAGRSKDAGKQGKGGRA